MSDHPDDLPNAPHYGATTEVQEAASARPTDGPEPEGEAYAVEQERQTDAVEPAAAADGAGAPEGEPGAPEPREPQPGDIEAARDDESRRERRRRHNGRGRGRRRGPPPLPPDDPFWQFGTPPETWGSTVRRPERPRTRRPRTFLECRRCGIKMEKKRVHRDRVRCPMCGHWMREVRPPSE